MQEPTLRWMVEKAVAAGAGLCDTDGRVLTDLDKCYENASCCMLHRKQAVLRKQPGTLGRAVMSKSVRQLAMRREDSMHSKRQAPAQASSWVLKGGMPGHVTPPPTRVAQHNQGIPCADALFESLGHSVKPLSRCVTILVAISSRLHCEGDQSRGDQGNMSTGSGSDGWDHDGTYCCFDAAFAALFFCTNMPSAARRARRGTRSWTKKKGMQA